MTGRRLRSYAKVVDMMLKPLLYELKALPCDDDMSEETEAFCGQLQFSLVRGNFGVDPILYRSFDFYLSVIQTFS